MVNPGLLYILAAPLLYFTRGKIRKAITLLTALLVLLSIWFMPYFPQGPAMKFDFLDFELILYQSDSMRRFVGLIFAFFALGGLIYSFNYRNNKFYFLAALYIGSAIMPVFVGDLFSFYILWEMMAISSFFLIYNYNNEDTQKRSYYYFLMHLAGGLCLLLGILIHYHATGSLEITTIEHGIPFFVLGVAFKLAFIGVHTWLVKTYAYVPFQVSVVLSAFTTKMGVFAMYLFLGDIDLILGIAGTISAIIGVIFALKQSDARRLLSYHIISQVGYMIAGIGVGTYLGIVGGIMHLFSHILYKGLLFMAIGTVIYCTGEENLVDLGGIAKKLPFTTFCCGAASLAIAGVPFFNGYISKLVIKNGVYSLEAGVVGDLIIWGLLIAGIGTALSFIKVMYFGFFRKVEAPVEIKRKPTLFMKLGMGVILVFMLLLGIMPSLYESMGYFAIDINYFSLSYIWEGFLPFLLALVIFKIAHDIIEPHEHAESDFDIYLIPAWLVDKAGVIFSALHNGDLSRYLLWVLGSLSVLWIYLLA